ncbi:hypothetical protein BKA62DRAFT_673876 [Auriculariales sp. MPI-PUGE-AT-0066]|nr:hypothetical protein BKA62DRAFT_673876 [Auriculariales sp. MPI-PUGE-AT-0066]
MHQSSPHIPDSGDVHASPPVGDERQLEDEPLKRCRHFQVPTQGVSANINEVEWTRGWPGEHRTEASRFFVTSEQSRNARHGIRHFSTRCSQFSPSSGWLITPPNSGSLQPVLNNGRADTTLSVKDLTAGASVSSFRFYS